jgi:uncharacterized membrane protein
VSELEVRVEEGTLPPQGSVAVAHEADVAGPELLISGLLRTGVLLSLAFVVSGMVLSFIHHPDYLSSAESLQRLTAPQHAPHTLSEVLAGAAAVRGQAFVMVGLLLLIATPVLRVGLSLVLFQRQGDRTFTRITGVVLTLLLIAFLLGRAGE